MRLFMTGVGWGEPARGWQLGVLVGDELPAAELNQVTVLLKNVGEDIQTVHETSYWANDLEVIGACGALPLTDYARSCRFSLGEGKYRPVDLLPGEVFQCTVPLTLMFSGLRKGDYRLQASREVRLLETESVRVTSGIVGFRLVGKKKKTSSK
jgi:hypothetical protein